MFCGFAIFLWWLFFSRAPWTERLGIVLLMIVALVAGPYAEWRDEHADETGSIPLGIYCRASLAEHMDAERLFTEMTGCQAFTVSRALSFPISAFSSRAPGFAASSK